MAGAREPGEGDERGLERSEAHPERDRDLGDGGAVRDERRWLPQIQVNEHEAGKLGYAGHCYGSAERLIEAQNRGSVCAAHR